MWRLGVEIVPFWVIEGGKIGFECTYVLNGLVPITDNEVKLRYVGSRVRKRETVFQKGDLVCVYFAHYGYFIGAGVTRVEYAVAEMGSHAPFIAVGLLGELNDDVVNLLHHLKHAGLRIDWDTREIVAAWNNPPRGFISEVERIEREKPEIVTDILGLESYVDVVERYCDMIYEPGLHWLTTRRVDRVPPVFDRKIEQGAIVRIKQLANNLLTVNGFSCRVWDIVDMVFEMLE